MTESSLDQGLVVTYDEETLTFTFDWNHETHPEYNFLLNWTSQDLIKLITEYLKHVENETDGQTQTKIQARGSSSGETESNNNPEPIN